MSTVWAGFAGQPGHQTRWETCPPPGVTACHSSLTMFATSFENAGGTSAMVTHPTLTSYRAEFPLTAAWAYLDHASFGPLPRRTSAAVAAVTAAFSSPATMDIGAYEAAIEQARRNVATLVGGAPERVAFASSASDAMALCASGIAWQAGDNVVLSRDDHPSVVYPFLNLSRLGVEVRFAE